MSLKQTKCPKCGKEYEGELDNLQDRNGVRSKHLSIGKAHTFQDSWGTQYEWNVTVRCDCGNKFTFEEST